MGLSKPFDQRLKELKVLWEEMVLAIRKAFSLEDLSHEGFYLGKHPVKGFGLVSAKDPGCYIFAYPDIISRQIRVSVVPYFANALQAYRLDEQVCYLDCKDLTETTARLQSMVLGFLVESTSRGSGEEINW